MRKRPGSSLELPETKSLRPRHILRARKPVVYELDGPGSDDFSVTDTSAEESEGSEGEDNTEVTPPATQQLERAAPSPDATPAVLPTPDAAVVTTANFCVSVKLDSKFSTSPPEIRSALERAYSRALQSHSITSLSSTRLSDEHSPYYTLNTGHFTRSFTPQRHFEATNATYTHVEMANVALLEHFLGQEFKPQNNSVPVEFVRNSGDVDGAVVIVNPEFLQCHAVRGDVGWGFDAGGALSLLRMEREGGGEIRSRVWFVERLEVKAQAEAEGEGEGDFSGPTGCGEGLDGPLNR